jgi:hypothetical protein
VSDEPPRHGARLPGPARLLLWIVAVSLVVFFGGNWLLNNTRLGIQVKCRVFNDVGACFLDALTTPINANNGDQTQDTQPPATPDPAQVQAEQQAAIERAISSVRSALDDLVAAQSGLTDDLTSTQQDLDSMKGDLGTVATDKATVASEAKNGTDAGVVCGDAGVVSGDAGVVSGDLGVIEGDGGVLQGSFSVLDNAVATLTTQVMQMRQAMSVLGSSVPASAPSDTEISAALGAASTAGAAAHARYDQLYATARGYVKQANDLAAAAQAICDRL